MPKLTLDDSNKHFLQSCDGNGLQLHWSSRKFLEQCRRLESMGLAYESPSNTGGYLFRLTKKGEKALARIEKKE